MSVSVKLILSLVIAAIAASIVSTLQTGAPFSAALWLAFAVACVACALLGNLPLREGRTLAGDRASQPAPKQQRTASSASSSSSSSSSLTPGERETGKVKWFNVAKGFGFIIRENNEEIFVHFRAIQGNSRRGLRDGQPVSFVVKQSDKGPQAEDVIAEDAG